MTYNEIAVYLCVYDIRNPFNCGDFPPRKDCYCDNCASGRTILAKELLKYVKG